MKDIFEQQKEWFKLGYSKSVTYRESMLRRLKQEIKSHEHEIMEALEKDLGKHPTESYITEFFMVYKSIDHTIKNLRKWSKDKRVKTPLYLKPGYSYTRSIPFGVSLVMSAYNYPLLLSLDPLIGSMAGGNTTMLALSSHSHHTNEVIIKMLNQAFDSKYLYTFETGREINEDMLTYPFDKIFFTGSEKVGKIVLKGASANLVSTTLELGGKSPAVVLRDAHLKKAARNIMYSKVLNSGQTCVASDYVMVDHMIADEFITELELSLKTFHPNFDQYPKLVSKQHYDHILDMIDKDKEYMISKVDLDEKHLKIMPVILKVNLKNVDLLESMKHEIFGPILPVIIFEDLNESLRYINTHPTPLAMYIFGRRKAMIDRVLVNVDSGGVAINSTIMHMVNEHLPFSGFRQSGMGNYHGKYSFDTFSYTQGVYRKTFLQAHKIIFPPYKDWFKK